MSHDLVDLPILLAADKLLVLIGEFDFDTHLILTSPDKWDLMNNNHSRLYRIVGAIDSERQIIKADFCSRVGADIGKHYPNISRRRDTESSL